jgi:hypothetical protein
VALRCHGDAPAPFLAALEDALRQRAWEVLEARNAQQVR